VEVIDRGTNQAKPRRKHAKYLDTRSGRLRLAVIADNSAASIEAFVRANVKPGTTLLTDGHASYPGRSEERRVGKVRRCRRHTRWPRDWSSDVCSSDLVEVIDRGTNQAKPRRKHAKYLDTRSGRLRLAVIADNSAASIEAFVRANVKPGTTLLTDGHASYPGLSGYRHDPRVVGTMAGHIVLPWSHRAFSLLKRWALGTYHGLRRKHVDTYLNEFVFRYNRRFYRHVSFEALLGLATHHEPTGYWDIIKRDNPRKSAGRHQAPRLLHID